MTFLKLFLICMFKEPNLAEKRTNLAENLFLKLNSTEFTELFSPSLLRPQQQISFHVGFPQAIVHLVVAKFVVIAVILPRKTMAIIVGHF